MALVVFDQRLAQRRLEDPGHDEDRRLDGGGRRGADAGHPPQHVEDLSRVLLRVVLEGQGEKGAQAQVEEDRVPPVASRGGIGDGPVQPAHGEVEVPEEADPGERLPGPPLAFVLRVGADAEEAGVRVVERRPRGREVAEDAMAHRVGDRPEEAQHDVTPGGRVEVILRGRRGAGHEPRGRFAEGQQGLPHRRSPPHEARFDDSDSTIPLTRVVIPFASRAPQAAGTAAGRNLLSSPRGPPHNREVYPTGGRP